MANFNHLLDQWFSHSRVNKMKHARLLSAIPFFVLLCCFAGCGYPEVSPKTYEISKALYSACNRKSAEHVTKASELIEVHHESGNLSEREAKWLREIVRDAESGSWEAATLEARQLMEDQIDK